MISNNNPVQTGTARVSGAALLVSAVLIAACTPKPELQIDMAPQGAVAERGYGAVADDHLQASDLVRQALEAKGGMSAADGWRVQSTLAVRPVGVGAFADSPARDGIWSAGPRVSGARRGAQLHVLSVVLERSDGSQHRVVQVSARSDALETPPLLLAQLAEAAADAAYEGARTGPVQD